MVAVRSGGNQGTKAWMLPIRQAETPRPISARARTSASNDCAFANVMPPAAASTRPELARERRPEHGIHRAKHVRQVVTRQERQDDPEKWGQSNFLVTTNVRRCYRKIALT